VLHRDGSGARRLASGLRESCYAQDLEERSVTYRADAEVPSLARKVAMPEQYQAAGCVKVGKANTKGRVSPKP